MGVTADTRLALPPQISAMPAAAVARYLDARTYPLDAFSVADAYLFTVLNRAPHAGLDLGAWPAIKAYVQRLRERPAIAQALADGVEIFMRERAELSQRAGRT